MENLETRSIGVFSTNVSKKKGLSQRLKKKSMYV